MTIRSVKHNDRRKAFEIRWGRRTYSYPYAKADPPPTAHDPIAKSFVDPELARHAFTYVLKSGKQGVIHVDQVLYYNGDPDYLRNLLLYNLTVGAQERLKRSPLPRREVLRRLGISAKQLAAILDQTNYRKTVDQVLRVLYVLGHEIVVTVQPRDMARKSVA